MAISIRTNFSHSISLLQEQILEMATCADTMVADSVRALIEGDVELVRQIVQRDDIVDRLDIEIEAQCLNLIALQQPVARDLRVIGTALKIITDIERIADYAVDIAKIGRRIQRNNEIYRPLVDLPQLTMLTRDMLRNALQAFIQHDLLLVEKVIQDDDAVDNLYHEMREYLTHVITTDSSKGLVALNVMFAAKYLERISDHVVNIAERVYFIEKGELHQLAASHLANSDEALN